ncbi:hypothetical protein ABW20_dc0107989 [Dactylellina cionopaga]|nr:hypothetical protein ABW20_dc0107989 [Dactylellina cionopaga]
MSALPRILLRKPAVLTQSQQALQLLRQLYRETSCLFDEFAREQVKRRIRDRFKECQKIKDEQRRTKLLKDGRKFLSTLTRANNGDKWRVVRVLQLAYGQKGKLKHELLKPLLKEAQPEPPLIPGKRRSAPPATPPKLLALFKAQVGKTIKVPEPTIPQETATGKPFPLIRIPNVQWNHRSMVLNRITPPLAPVDFERMELLVMGFKKTIPTKRKFITRETRVGPKRQRPNVYNGRMQRRILRFLLEQFPMLEYKESPRGSKWVAKYSPVLTTTLHTPGDPEDFEGVDEKGEPEGIHFNPNKMLKGRLAMERNRARGKATAFSNWLEEKKAEGKIPEPMAK